MMSLRRYAHFLHHPNDSTNVLSSISKSLCGYTCIRTTLSTFEESCGRLWLNFVISAPYGRLCSSLIVTGVAKGYWDVSSGNSDPRLPIFDVSQC
jgi:hypothetical protein